MSDKALFDLFDALAEKLGERLKSDDCSSADLNTIRQFLRDNNITATNPRSNPALKNLVENLPYDEDSAESRH